MAFRVRCLADPALLELLGRVAVANERVATALEKLDTDNMGDEDLERLKAVVTKLTEDNAKLRTALDSHTKT